MCYEPRNEELAKVCRERDELKAAYDGAKLAMKALNEKLVQVTAERDALKRELEETKELLEAAKNAQGLLQIHLVKVQEERDALFEEARGFCHTCKKGIRISTAKRNAMGTSGGPHGNGEE